MMNSFAPNGGTPPGLASNHAVVAIYTGHADAQGAIKQLQRSDSILRRGAIGVPHP